MNLYLYHNSDKKTSPKYTLKLQNQYKTTFYFPTVNAFVTHLAFWRNQEFPGLRDFVTDISENLLLQNV